VVKSLPNVVKGYQRLAFGPRTADGRIVVRRLLTLVLATALVLVLPASARAADEDEAPDTREQADPDELIAGTIRWLGRQQVADGGFDGAIAGGGTPDAILALAESAQTGTVWSNRAAFERVDAEVSRDGATPLDAVRRLARANDEPAVAARLITRVALPLGLEPSGEGPLGDLVTPVTEGLHDDDVLFGDRVELAIALLSAGAALPEGTIEGVLATQQDNGGWNGLGDADGDVVDLRTTGAVVDLLVLSGTSPDHEAVQSALSFVASAQDRQGTWPDREGEPSTVATAGAIRAIRALGHDPASTCWQTSVGADAAEQDPLGALATFQTDDGGFRGADPVPEASEAVHALSGRWLPRGRAPTACLPEEEGLLPFAPSLLVLGAILLVCVGGGVRILRAPASY
jgi:hypothetical protein